MSHTGAARWASSRRGSPYVHGRRCSWRLPASGSPIREDMMLQAQTVIDWPNILGTDDFWPALNRCCTYQERSSSSRPCSRSCCTRFQARRTSRAWTTSLKVSASASIALVFTVPMVQVFLNSTGGAAGYDQMPIVLRGRGGRAGRQAPGRSSRPSSAASAQRLRGATRSAT